MSTAVRGFDLENLKAKRSPVDGCSVVHCERPLVVKCLLRKGISASALTGGAV